MTLAAIAAAIAVLLWPSPKAATPAIPPLPGGAEPLAAVPSMASAMTALSIVRRRLTRTQMLTDAEKAAIDLLTLAVAGGDEK